MAISKELKEKWLERLRSPDAKWAGSQLHDTETGGMCCLGHLADLQGDLVDRCIYHPDGEGSEADCSYYDSIKLEWVYLYGLDKLTQDDLVRDNDGLKRFPIELIEALPVEEAS